MHSCISTNWSCSFFAHGLATLVILVKYKYIIKANATHLFITLLKNFKRSLFFVLYLLLIFGCFFQYCSMLSLNGLTFFIFSNK
ncbi:unnamed protein product [Meloidogyne enterolobii]|uniref:Uncharacterized protein n=1 Tax=Meloidogyne enterolobii TaxID=390850 RepID=A0ACB1A7D3_MELEN